VPNRRRRFVATLIGAAFAVSIAAPALAVNPPPRPARPLPASVTGNKLKTSITSSGTTAFKLDRVLRVARGPQRVAVRLSEEAAVDVAASGATAQRAQVKKARAQQDTFIKSARRLDRNSRLLGRTSKATNVVMMQINAASLPKLADDPGVVSIVPIHDYQLALGETVPYVGAAAVQAAGYTGKGVRVAILDSGIDYTHVAFGGPGTTAAYVAAYGTGPADPKNTTTDGLFPTARVVGGYDFVGEKWKGGASTPPEAPDPDPIDAPSPAAGLGTDGGHGTHVADIVGGAKGVAPGASLYAVKVCSSVSTACSGVALIQGMDFAVDPNGDGDTRDHVDVVNMSLGSDYGTAFDDDLSYAVDQASKLGVLTVAASGNGGNKPYVSGTPAAAASAISVAQTEVPSAVQFPLVVNSPASIAGTYANTATVEWAPLGAGFSGDVAYVGRGCPAGSKTDDPAADPYLANPAGKVALIDRGACSDSLKVDRAA
jgi:subtilisin family serine protease